VLQLNYSYRRPLAVTIFAFLLMVSGCSDTQNSSTVPTNAPSSPTTASPVNTSGTQPDAKGKKIDINKAPIAELDKLELPGTKPSLSERIQGARPYKTIDDLVAKKAISAEELALIVNLVTVGEDSAAASSSKININKATIAELDKLELPGTKPSLSERIQGSRPYKDPEDMVKKKAISQEELDLIKNLVTTAEK
jgi:DNA uptake protein ComE-like DNA-binding protein